MDGRYDEMDIHSVKVKRDDIRGGGGGKARLEASKFKSPREVAERAWRGSIALVTGDVMSK
jgi:hypothetical protein